MTNEECVVLRQKSESQLNHWLAITTCTSTSLQLT